MIALLWPDGSLHRGRTWDEALEDLHQHPWNRDLSEIDFRHALAKRAWVWDMIELDPEAPAEELLRGLTRAGLIQLVDEEEE